MAKSCYFFATREDLLQIIQRVESSLKLKYVKNDAHDTSEPKIYESLADYEDLGIKHDGEHQSECFTVLEQGQELVIREVPQRAGGVKYFVDEGHNPGAVTLWLGGFYQEEFIICGHIATINTSPQALNIFKLFQKAIKKQCPYV